MKNFKTLMLLAVAGMAYMFTTSGCELAGLSLQKDYNRVTNVDTIDAHLNKSAWDYLKGRAYGSKTDTIFRRMYDAIIYSGIDTTEYMKPGRTFIFLNNGAISTAKTGLWALVTNAKKAAGKSWKDYAPADVKTYLQYLIVTNQYSHYNLPINDVQVQTLAPAGSYATNPAAFTFSVNFVVPNPNSTMRLRVVNASASNTSDYPLQINDNVYVATSDLLATNGVVQVCNTFITPGFLQ